MIALFTDFGVADPYVGQLHAVFAKEAVGFPVVDLFHHSPNFDIRAAAYLLPAYAGVLPAGSIVLAVVDPGVGGRRRPVMLQADGIWYVGPDNGLFELIARRADEVHAYHILWRPQSLSASFHARDLFAPVAAQLARGQMPASEPSSLTPPSGEPWPDDLAQILYIDHYGNLVTGLRAEQVDSKTRFQLGQHLLGYARVFSEAKPGKPFWYCNANGLVEFAANQAHAAELLGIEVPGTEFSFVS